MGIVMNAENDLEKAVWQGDAALVMQAVAEGENLNRLAAVSCLDNENFSDAVIFSVLLIALRREQLQTMTSEWCQKRLRIGERLKKLVQEALEPLPQTPGNVEKALLKQALPATVPKFANLLKMAAGSTRLRLNFC